MNISKNLKNNEKKWKGLLSLSKGCHVCQAWKSNFIHCTSNNANYQYGWCRRFHGCGHLRGIKNGYGISGAIGYGVSAGTAAAMTPGSELCRKEDADKIFEWLNDRN